jgi:putative ABC transport system permease protein
MSHWRRLALRLLNAAWPWRSDRELDREVRAHLALLEDDLTQRGLPRPDARIAARRRLGEIGRIKEQHRDARSFWLLEDLRRDLRYAARMLRRSPGVSGLAVASLALGIGANTVVFSIADNLLVRPLPVPHSEQLVDIRENRPGSRPRTEVPTWQFTGLRDGIADSMTVAAINVFDRSNITLAAPGRAPVDAGRCRVAIVSGNYFPMLEAPAAIGRVLTTDDDRVPGGHPVAVLSDACWTRHLARSADVLGATVTINRTAFSIVGVMPAGFTGDWVGRPADVWVTTMMQGRVMVEAPDALTKPNDYWLRLVGRLKPGVTRQHAEASFQPIYQQVLRSSIASTPSPQTLENLARQRIGLLPGAHGYSPERETLSPFMTTLTLVAALVLLVVCANVAGLLLSRAAARQREFAVRLAIGASRARLARQLVIESLLIAAAGGVAGTVLAVWGTRAMARTLATAPVQMFWANSSWLSFDVQLSWRGLIFTAGISVVAGVVFGLAPMVRAGRVALAPALSARANSVSGATRLNMSKVLVVVQVAISLVVIVAATLLVRTLLGLRSQDLGIERRNVVLAWTQPSSTGRQGRELQELWHDVQTRLSVLPGVTAVSASNSPVLSGVVPPAGRAVEQMRVEGQPPRLTPLPGSRTFVMPDFFKTLGVPLLSGREFTERDSDQSPPVVILNESMVRLYFGDANPVGRRVGFGPQPGTPVEVVGVVKDFELGSPRGADRPQMLTFFPYRSDAGPRLVIMCVVIRTSGPPRSLMNRVREELRAVDPSLAVLKINTPDEQLDDVLAQDRLLAGLAAFFGGVSGLLACLGLYGLVSHMTARRTSEIGLRIAFGATAGRVLAIVLGEGMRLVCLGILVGAPSALMAMRLIRSRLFHVRPDDPLTLGLAAGLMVAVALVAALVPARRAARLDPMVALREG